MLDSHSSETKEIKEKKKGGTHTSINIVKFILKICYHKDNFHNAKFYTRHIQYHRIVIIVNKQKKRNTSSGLTHNELKSIINGDKF